MRSDQVEDDDVGAERVQVFPNVGVSDINPHHVQLRPVSQTGFHTDHKQ